MNENSVRLASDQEKLAALAKANPSLIKLVSSQGRPPSQYLLELHCRGIDRISRGTVIYRESHTIEILLGPEYPFREPKVEFKTPILHPHIWPNNRVCLGDWRASEFLDLLVKRLFGVIQFFPEYLNADSVANHGAQDWLDDNEGLIPLGSVVPGRAPTAPARPRFIFTPQ